MKRRLAIGDVHGCRYTLEQLLDYAHPTEDDEIIMLGDYVDRGPDSKGVIELLIALQKSVSITCLKGNHEIMMQQSAQDSEYFSSWLGVGGKETLQSYGVDDLKHIPSAHWDFLNSLDDYYETEDVIFVHANAYPELDMVDQPDYMLFWEKLSQPAPHYSGKRLVCGHTAQKSSGMPLSYGHTICIDTYAYGTGSLTCLDAATGHYWQVNRAGERFCDVIDIEFSNESG